MKRAEGPGTVRGRVLYRRAGKATAGSVLDTESRQSKPGSRSGGPGLQPIWEAPFMWLRLLGPAEIELQGFSNLNS